MFIFFFKQKTAYEMRISDWSSDVCSSDLRRTPLRLLKALPQQRKLCGRKPALRDGGPGTDRPRATRRQGIARAGQRTHLQRRDPAPAGRVDRKSVVEGKSVSVRVDLGGCRIIKKKTKAKQDKTT